MDVPELYRYGREGRWFGLRLFTIYMLDGVYQVCSYLLQLFDAEFRRPIPVRRHFLPHRIHLHDRDASC
jgi:hypothetical protein